MSKQGYLWEDPETKSQITRDFVIWVQVCVPADMPDDQIPAIAFKYESTVDGHRENPEFELVPNDVVNCASRPGYVHRILHPVFTVGAQKVTINPLEGDI